MISVVIPLYNGEKVIEECIKSLSLSLEGIDSEIIIVDDKSIDKSVENIKKNLCTRVSLLQNRENLGYAKTVMRGVKYAKGDIVILLNMDTLVEKEWCSELIRPLERDRNIGITGAKIFMLNSGLLEHAGGYLAKNALSYHIGKGEEDIGFFASPLEVEYVCGASIACRKEIFLKIGGFDAGYSPLYYEEIDLADRMKRLGLKVLFVPSSKLKHYSNYTLKNNDMKIFYYSSRNRLRYVLKAYGIKKILLDFLFHEIRYIYHLDFLKKLCLFKAYIYISFKIPEILIKRLKDIILIQKLKAASFLKYA